MMSVDIRKPVLIFKHQAFDAAFQALYDEGMRLIEETAAYIDDESVSASRELSGEAVTFFSSEAMRVSTRLMQVASWLLLMRAGREKEMSEELIAIEKAKISLNTPTDKIENGLWAEMPITFKGLVERSIRLEERVRHLDFDLMATAEKEFPNPVNEQIGRLAAALSRS